MGAGGEAQGAVVKPTTDKLEYSVCVLPNGLQALLISDPETDKASAALDVNVGSMADPPEMPGLAHFVEHMLFYSSERFPEEDAYSKFISEHGGSTNAFTAAEDTCFHFDVNQEHLGPALERFAQFFICPLVSEDGVQREANAVDSEHGKNLNSDAWRLSRLWRATADPAHAFAKWGTGSLETLITNPTAAGADPRAAVRDFAARRYSANLMRLALYGRESCAELAALAADAFGAVTNRQLPPSAFPGGPVLPQQLGTVIRAVPQREGDSLRLQWPIPPQQRLFRSQPCGYISHLLGHEGEGSVFALLRARGWATQLSAGESGLSYSGQSFLEVTILLTREGQKHAREVCSLIFQYIRMLAGPGGVTQERFAEIQALARMEFSYGDKIRPGRLTPLLAQTLQHVPAELALLALYHVPLDWDPAAIHAILECLTPGNARLLWASHDFQGQTDSKERWYGTEHSVGPIPRDWLAAWQADEPGSGLHLPQRNPFVPTDFSLLPEQASGAAGSSPAVIHASELLTLWHKPETRFAAPKAVAYLSLESPEAYASPEAAVLTRLLAKLLSDGLSEVSYDAELAGLSWSAQNTAAGLLVSFAGFSHKLPTLAGVVFERLVSFQTDPERFAVVREAVAREYANMRYQQPYETATYSAAVVHELKRWHVDEYRAVIGQLTPADLQAWLPRLLRRVAVTAFVSGNLSAEAAVALAGGLEQLLQERAGARPLFPSQRAEARVVRLRPGRPALLALPTPNPENENSAIMLEYQVGPDDLRLNALSELLVRCLKQEAFHVLRSQQQLGYIVALTTWSHSSVRALAFILQSTAHPAETLEQRCEAFLAHAAALLQGMTEAEFAARVEELAKDKLERPLRLGEQAAREWREIDSGTQVFGRPEAEVAELQRLTRADLTAFFQEHMLDPHCRRKLSVQVRAAAQAAAAAPEAAAAADGKVQAAESGSSSQTGPAVEQITDMWAFKRRQEAYPSFK